MATGYTHDVKDGKLTDFPAFAMRCARAFGPLVDMRDDPMDAPIPEKFEPSKYHVEAKAVAEARLAALIAMSDDDCRAGALNDFKTSQASYDAAVKDRIVTKERYEKMLNQVLAWTPPTPNHEGLKRFMVEQLSTSIDFDFSGSYYKEPPVLMPAKEWLNLHIEMAQHDVTYHTEKLVKDELHAQSQTDWVKSLRQSLQPLVAETCQACYGTGRWGPNGSKVHETCLGTGRLYKMPA